MTLAFQLHHDTHKYFPSGGVRPWPAVVFKSGAIATGTDQEMGWAFQILPYMEMGNIFNLGKPTGQKVLTCSDTGGTETLEILPGGVNGPVDKLVGSIETPFFFCPSRRSDARWEAGSGTTILMDYASATPGLEGRGLGDSFWLGGSHVDNACGKREPFYGVVVRGRYHENCSMRHVKDGASNTILLGEKWLDADNYRKGDWHDDRGWTDGWDPDIIRSTGIAPHPDSPQDPGNGPYRFGGVHAGGFNACFTDGSVQFLSFNVDTVLFNRMGDRRDGLPTQ
jgi:prepilin-type processing-associated H-X9-DG protein